jgi:hypothetical protein
MSLFEYLNKGCRVCKTITKIINYYPNAQRIAQHWLIIDYFSYFQVFFKCKNGVKQLNNINIKKWVPIRLSIFGGK